MIEADTCRELITPKLVAAGWGTSESVIGEQHSFTDGRIIVAGGKVRRGKQRRADHLLHDWRDMPLTVVEAKELLRVKHAVIREANAALLPTTLERIFHAEAPA